MHIVVVGLSHQSAPIALREKLAFRREDLPKVFARLRDDYAIKESAVLSTCNRVEIYARTSHPEQAGERLTDFLTEWSRVPHQELVPHLYRFPDPRSVQHLFAVASGLESMILGENEILGQVKHAYEWAKTDGATGKVFNVLFQKAINAAKDVRTQTAIGRGHASVGSVAVDLARKIFGRLHAHRVLLVGAGKIGELTLKHLVEERVAGVCILNRTAEKAERLAQASGATTRPLAELEASLIESDIVITSASVSGALLTAAQVGAVMRQRHQRPLCIVDLGVPRNVDAAVGRLENVYLFDVDDLQGLVKRSIQSRAAAVAESRAILERKTALFLAWWKEEASACDPWSSARVAVP